MKYRQSGISLVSMIIVVIFLACALLVGFKMVGPYTEYYALERIIGVVADEGNNGATEAEMRKSYTSRAVMDSIDGTIKPDDLVFRKQGRQVVIEVEYTRKTPLVGNVSLAFDFKASSLHSRK